MAAVSHALALKATADYHLELARDLMARAQDLMKKGQEYADDWVKVTGALTVEGKAEYFEELKRREQAAV